MPIKIIRVKDIDTAKRHTAVLLADGYKCKVYEDDTYAICEKVIERHGDLLDTIIIEWL
ncbi:MAG: hypothetical protein QXT64_08640 [Desulfurococcaceae archaeon]